MLIGNVLDAFDDIDPSKLIVKSKLHLLVHLPEDICRTGPAIRKSVETFESYNGVFRLCAILSNRQAVSRDIARKFLSMDCTKHLLCGGFYSVGDKFVQAGEAVRRLLHDQPVIQRHLGWTPMESPELGC